MLLLIYYCRYIWLKSDRKGGKKGPLSPALKAKQSKGSLQFEALQIIHDGFYVCQACHRGEWVESAEVHLMVTTPGSKASLELQALALTIVL